MVYKQGRVSKINWPRKLEKGLQMRLNNDDEQGCCGGRRSSSEAKWLCLFMIFVICLVADKSSDNSRRALLFRTGHGQSLKIVSWFRDLLLQCSQRVGSTMSIQKYLSMNDPYCFSDVERWPSSSGSSRDDTWTNLHINSFHSMLCSKTVTIYFLQSNSGNWQTSRYYSVKCTKRKVLIQLPQFEINK
jgi:hypothetical protein